MQPSLRDRPVSQNIPASVDMQQRESAGILTRSWSSDIRSTTEAIPILGNLRGASERRAYNDSLILKVTRPFRWNRWVLIVVTLGPSAVHLRRRRENIRRDSSRLVMGVEFWPRLLSAESTCVHVIAVFAATGYMGQVFIFQLE